jgi:hypothetical protein
LTQNNTRTFTLADPRTFEDGTPYEVAARAGAQAVALAKLLQWAVEGADLMARNAYMTRNLDLGNDACGDQWRMHPEGKNWAAIDADLATLRRKLETLTTAASYDPKHPPR